MYHANAISVYSSQLLRSTASPNPFTIVNPDGSKEVVTLNGGEGRSWMEDSDGYTICPEVKEEDGDELPTRRLGGKEGKKKKKKAKKTTYFYCTRDESGDFVPDKTLQVGLAKPAKGSKHPKGRKPKKQEDRECGEFCTSKDADRRLQAKPRQLKEGSLKNLVVLMRFSDHSGRSLPTEADIEILMNGGVSSSIIPTGSVRDVFLQNSAEKLSLDSTVADWVTISRTEEECAAGESGLTSNFWPCLREALDLVDQSVNFSNFDDDNNRRIDAITFLHSGYGAEVGGTDAFGASNADRIWSHKWNMNTWTSNEDVRVSTYHISPAVWGTSGSEIGRIGVIAHETGHFLGLPDLYDYGSGAGLGSWSLMANSWGHDGSQRYPPALDPWCKWQLGWITPTLVTSNTRITIKPSYTQNDYYVVRAGFASGEYLLIENRQRMGFDGIIPKVGGI